MPEIESTNEDTAIVKRSEASPVRVHVFATSGEEMARASQELSSWLSFRVNQAKVELRQLEKNLELAKKHKWSTATWRTAISKAKGTVTYYEKVKAAVGAGYMIVPELNANWFAVRTSREKPTYNLHDNLSYRPSRTEVDLPPEPLGEGEHVSSECLGESEKYQNEKGETRFRAWDTEFAEVNFPVRFVRPEIIEATAEAMRLKIFDAFGLVGGRRKDPLVVGLIKGPHEGWTRKRLYFVVGWFLDTRSL